MRGEQVDTELISATERTCRDATFRSKGIGTHHFQGSSASLGSGCTSFRRLFGGAAVAVDGLNSDIQIQNTCAQPEGLKRRVSQQGWEPQHKASLKKAPEAPSPGRRPPTLTYMHVTRKAATEIREVKFIENRWLCTSVHLHIRMVVEIPRETFLFVD